MDRRNYGSMAATAAVVEDDADPDSEEEEAGFRVVLEKVPSEGVSTEKAPTRAFSGLKAATTAFTFKTLLTPRSLCVKLGPRRNYHKGQAAIRHYANQTARPL